MPISTGITVIPARYFPIYQVALDALGATNILFPPMTLAGHPINSPFTDVDGIGWIVNALEGWDAPTVRVTETPRGNNDGLYHQPSFYGGRLLVAKGAFISIAGPAALMAARERLHATVDITGTALAPLIVNESPPKMCMVQRLDGYHDRPVGTAAFEFEIHLLANDPNKYDPTPSTTVLANNTTAVITNLGTRASFPMLSVRGPSFGFTISNTTTGQNLAFAQALSSSDVFTIDMDRKSAKLNGVSAIASIASDPLQWWALVPGANTIQFTATGGAVTALWSSAWT